MEERNSADYLGTAQEAGRPLMNCYVMKFERFDMPAGFVASYLKIARDEKEALSYVVKSREKSGVVVFKKGGVGRLLSISITL